MPQVDGVSHIAFTVSDLAKSKEWYADVLGWQSMFEGEDGGIHYALGVIPHANLLVGLRQHDAGTGEAFDPGRTGLDHVAFGVPSRAALDEWEAEFKSKGVNYTETIDAPYGQVLNFKDPDNIALEIFAMAGS
jgi:catechol 2,3-dioxygenase-like lactoylglutathione lyase family enzyme